MAVRSPPTDESDIEDAIPREPFAWVLSLAFPPPPSPFVGDGCPLTLPRKAVRLKKRRATAREATKTGSETYQCVISLGIL